MIAFGKFTEMLLMSCEVHEVKTPVEKRLLLCCAVSIIHMETDQGVEVFS